MGVEAVEYGASIRGFYQLHAYVVMPNHVHVVWQPKTCSRSADDKIVRATCAALYHSLSC